MRQTDPVGSAFAKKINDLDGVPHPRPEVALLHKAHLDRPKDRADLAAGQGSGAAAASVSAAAPAAGWTSSPVVCCTPPRRPNSAMTAATAMNTAMA